MNYKQFLDELEVSFSFCMLKHGKLVVPGRINLNMLDMESPGVKYFLKMLQSLEMEEIIDQTTRVTKDSSNFTDIVLTHDPTSVICQRVHETDLPDHDLISCTLNPRKPFYYRYKCVRNFDYENFLLISSMNCRINIYQQK